jgi:hypothetical protein
MDFQKNTQISNYVKICPVEAVVSHGETDRQTGTMLLITAF